MGALGIVFGDIGTSPLYAFRESLTVHHAGGATTENIFSILSLIFWSLVVVVAIKYVIVIMRADNRGEGGTFALLALIDAITKNTRLANFATVLGLLGAAFFFGDCMLTPAISVLSALEGLKIVDPDLERYIIPLTILVISALFWIQSKGTGLVGKLFGPILLLWFITIGILGFMHIAKEPHVLYALSPAYALLLVEQHPIHSLFVLSTVFLAVTGGEALYADMGHFGKKPIRAAWFALVMPALVLNYFGQGALLLQNPEFSHNPFYLMAPPSFELPLVILASFATIIASQAVISGAFSVFRQAIQLDYLPRSSYVHTSGKTEGQIYVPVVNWMLYIAVVGLVLFFQTSSNLAGAYGIAVANTMLITTLLVTIVMRLKWRWSYLSIALVAVPLCLVDLAFVIANSIKIPHGGWFSLLVGLISYIFLSTWRRGRLGIVDKINKHGLPLENFIEAIDENMVRTPGTTVVVTGKTHIVPLSLLQSYKLTKSIPSQVVLVTVFTEDVPYVEKEHRIELNSFEKGFYRIILRYGFMQVPNIPKALHRSKDLGLPLDIQKISFFMSRSIIVTKNKGKMAKWRKYLFAVMSRNATNVADFFKIPSDRTVEFGIRLDL